MQNNTFDDTVRQMLLRNCLENGLSYTEVMKTVIEAYSFQAAQEELRGLQPVFDFVREFDSLTERLIEELQAKFHEPNYAKIATEINITVFGRHELGIRQLATEKELKRLAEFEKLLAYALENDFIKTEKDLVEHIKSKR